MEAVCWRDTGTSKHLQADGLSLLVWRAASEQAKQAFLPIEDTWKVLYDALAAVQYVLRRDFRVTGSHHGVHCGCPDRPAAWNFNQVA